MKPFLHIFILFPLCFITAPLFSDVVEVTEKNFAQIAEKPDRPLIIEVYANWCGACRKMKPRFEQAANQYQDVRFVKINIEKEPQLAARYKVSHLPTLLFFLPQQNSPSMRSTGLLSQKELNEKVEDLLSQSEGAW